jgi:hypothetical protein
MTEQSQTMARDLYLDLLIRCLANIIYKDRSKAPWRAPEYDATIRREGGDWQKRRIP